jgi:hypothetical protein
MNFSLCAATAFSSSESASRVSGTARDHLAGFVVQLVGEALLEAAVLVLLP